MICRNETGEQGEPAKAGGNEGGDADTQPLKAFGNDHRRVFRYFYRLAATDDRTAIADDAATSFTSVSVSWPSSREMMAARYRLMPDRTSRKVAGRRPEPIPAHSGKSAWRS